MFDLEKNIQQPVDDNAKIDFAKEIFSRRIKSTDKIKAAQYIMRIDNVKKISKENISVFIGRAKSRKSFAVTMFAAALSSGQSLYGKFNPNAAYKVLYIDTEQSADDVQLVTKRIHKMVGHEENLFMYALKPYTPEQRVESISLLLEHHRPDVLIIDGVRDLIYDINDARECTNIMSTLMKWNVDYDIHITTVLHQNKSNGESRGHIGAELDNKCQLKIRITQSEDDKTISEFKEVLGRGKGTEAFNFFVNNDYADFGIPEVVESLSFETNLDDPF